MASSEAAVGIHRLSHGISNFYIVEREGKVVLVDAGVPRDWERFTGALKSLGRKLADVEAIVLTHAHSDHTGFAEQARTSGRIPVWVHQLDEAVAKGGAQTPNEGKAGPYLLRLETWRTLIGLMLTRGTKIVPILEVSTFKDGESLPIVGSPKVIQLPGHTPGSSAIYYPDASALFTGDSLVLRNPLTGRKGPQIMPRGLNQNSRLALESLSRLEALDARLVLPGHGDVWTEGAAEAVRQARTAGLS